MGNTTLNIPSKYTTPIGYRKCGKPIYLIAGGEDDPNNPVTVPSTPVVDDPTGQGETHFSQADIEKAVKEAVEKARQQEKDKVYGRMEKLQSTVDELNADRKARADAEEQARKDAEEAKKKADEAELDTRTLLEKRDAEYREQLAKTESDFAAKLAAMQAERDQQDALNQKERAFQSVQNYRTQRLEEMADEIAPEFHPFVQGSTNEEIEASLALAKQQSDQVAAQVQEAMLKARQQTKGASVSGLTPVGPMDVQAGTKTYSAEDINAMSMEEYAKHRASLIGGGGSNNRGMFG